MKKLLFNGCSFMAGDCFAWEQFHKENNNPHPNQRTIEKFANELANFIPSTF